MGRSKLTALVALAVLAVSPRVRAQTAEEKATADAAFEDGKRLMAAHAYADACPKFAESVRLDPGIGAMLGLADCYDKNGQTASAWAEFREAAAMCARKSDPRETLARQNAARIEPTLTKLVIHVPHEADMQGLVVKRDGVEVGRALWEVAVPVDPGAHPVTASAPGAKDWETSVEAIAAPGMQTVTVPRLELAPAPIAPASPATAETAHPRGLPPQRLAGAITAGAGVVSAVVGSVLGVVAISNHNQSNANGHCDTNDQCDPQGLSLRQSAESAATGSTVAFVVAGVAVAGGAVLWFTAPKTASSTAATPTPRVGLAPDARGLSLVGTW